MNENENKLATAPVGKLLFGLALPAIAAQIVNLLYNMVDRIYIGHIPETGALALTGLGVAFPIIILIAAFSALFGFGGAPRASIEMGRGNHDNAEEIMGNSFAALVAAGLILTVGDTAPIIFLVSYILYSVVTSYFRPLISDLLLSATKTDVGAASSVMNFGFTVIGSIGMVVGSLAWSSYTSGLAITMLIFISITILVWLYTLKAKSINFDWK